jgi:hypothetical protein
MPCGRKEVMNMRKDIGGGSSSVRAGDDPTDTVIPNGDGVSNDPTEP